MPLNNKEQPGFLHGYRRYGIPAYLSAGGTGIRLTAISSSTSLVDRGDYSSGKYLPFIYQIFTRPFTIFTRLFTLID